MEGANWTRRTETVFCLSRFNKSRSGSVFSKSATRLQGICHKPAMHSRYIETIWFVRPCIDVFINVMQVLSDNVRVVD